jgi:Putative phage tail protein
MVAVMSIAPRHPLTIAGSGGGKGRSKGGGGTEAPNSLKSKQIARIVDLLSEGPIAWLANNAQSIFLDGVALQNPDGSLNFSNVSLAGVAGWPDQPLMTGFAAQQAETAVGIQLKFGPTNWPVRTIVDPNVDRCRITVSVPALQQVDKNNGNIFGTIVEFDIHVQANGGGFQSLGRQTIAGKTNTRYQRAVSFNLPGSPPWDIRLARVTADSTTVELQNDLFWDSYTAIIDDRVNYTLSACIGLTVDAEQFQAIPKRTYDLKGLYIGIPSNYDPIARTYSGVWDGTFQYNWSNNPAWVWLDLIRVGRYGLGNFIDATTQVDKWAIYRIAQWCDGMVPNGKGGYEPRFVCNAVIRDQQEAFDLVNSLASVFRGAAYWAGGMMVPIADMPADPVGQYTNANVIDGTFNYASSDIRARHNMASVAWNDPENLGEPRLAIVEDQEGISRYGIQKTDVIAVGCTSESQAIRVGKWTLFSETYEGETVNFRTGLETAWCRPGDIIQIADINIGGERRGGRIVSATASAIVVDAPVTFHAGQSHQISCVMPNGSIETRPASGSGETVDILPTTPFSTAPLPDSVWVLASSDLAPTLWRVITAAQTDADQYEITALRQHPDKWAYIENNIALSTPDISNIGAIDPVRDLNAIDYLVALSSISVGVRMLISWQSLAPSFEVAWRPVNGNWIRVRTEQVAHDVEAVEGDYEIWVTPINLLGRRGQTAKINYTVIGTSAPPLEPKQFRVKISDGVALFEWLPATELDVIIGGHFELRHSSRTSGANWASAQVVIPSIPGTATTVEAIYRVGTWFLKTFDIVGLESVKAATIIALQPDGRYTEFVRICENPDFLGNRFYTEVLNPQQWLVIGQTGGIWDDQMADMDSWPDVDLLAEGMPTPPQSAPRHGWYLFEDRIDAGGIFTVRFSADILAFPFQEGSEFIDDRLDPIDEWNDFDNVGADLGGQVQLFIRTTNDDPASPAAAWSAWQVFAPMEYTARAFEFRADLYAPIGQNIGIEELCIIADLRMKMDSDEDVPYPATTTHVTFKVKFYLVPAVVITVQNALATDTIQVLNKTRQGFDLNITNAGAQVTRVFDFQARGY